MCKLCGKERCKTYHASHKVEAREQYTNWRRRNLLKSDGLRFWFARQLGSYRKRAKDLGVPFDLTVDDLVHIYEAQQGKCYYTGEGLSWVSHKLSPMSMTADRKDPKEGYVAGNIVLCVFQVNTMKGAQTEDAFYRMCERILKTRDDRL